MNRTLKREIGLPGAVMLGLGSIVGTGVFVSIGIAAGVAGTGVLLAIPLAAALAACNGLSSAQLAAAHPVSGGTYEYGHRLLGPRWGFTAGWMFLLAKSASAATAALGFGGYALTALGAGGANARLALAVAALLGLTTVTLLGMRRTNTVNTVVVGLTLAALGWFVVRGLGSGLSAPEDAAPGIEWGVGGLLQATALMFVAYTGYGRIATLGEEVHAPRRTIPRAIIATLVVTSALYMLVGWTGVRLLGAAGLAAATEGAAAPLEIAAGRLGGFTRGFVALGAVTAMLGVLLNLLLGLSRVLLAMARRGEMPRWFARLDRDRNPAAAILGIALLIGGLALLGSVKTTWSFSAFTVLIYYGITNLAALRLDPADRLYPRWASWAGLAGCFGLAFFVEWQVWAAGLVLIGVGFLFQYGCRRIYRPQMDTDAHR